MHVVADNPVIPATAQYFTTHRDGELVMEDGSTLKFHSLWDTGASNSNYMSSACKHLSALVNDLRMKDKWSDPMILSLIQFHFNSSVSSEAGIAPFKALFGSDDETYGHLPEHLRPEEYQTEFVRRLDDSLRLLRAISAAHQAKLVSKRVDDTLVAVNQFAVGDLVLKSVRSPTKHWKPKKLGPSFYGPYQSGQTITPAGTSPGAVETFNVSMLKPYFGTVAMAKRAALMDKDQYEVKKVLHYTGDPARRTTGVLRLLCRW